MNTLRRLLCRHQEPAPPPPRPMALAMLLEKMLLEDDHAYARLEPGMYYSQSYGPAVRRDIKATYWFKGREYMARGSTPERALFAVWAEANP